METGRPLVRHPRPGARRPTPTSAWRRSSRRSAAGRDVVITGRVTDTGLTLGPIFHEFGWSPDDWDKVAAGTVAGPHHRVRRAGLGRQPAQGLAPGEGARQSRLPDRRGRRPTARFVVTKHPGTGGVVSVASVTEQLVYEMGDPHELHHPRRRRRLHHHPAPARPGRDRVRVSGIRGGPADADAQGVDRLLLRLQGGRHAGVRLARGLRQGARRRPRSSAQRLADLGLEFEQILTEFVGVDATHGRLSGPPRSRTCPRCSSASASAARRARAGRAVHPGDRAAGAHRAAERDRVRRRAAGGRGGRGLLAGADRPARRSSRTCGSRSWRRDGGQDRGAERRDAARSSSATWPMPARATRATPPTSA